MQWIKIWALTFGVFFVIDLLWLGVIARRFYRNQIGHLMSDTVNWPAALIFYALFIVGIMVFSLLPALSSGQWTEALLRGAFFGFMTYATYDLTNLATLQDWPLLVTFVDLGWGTILAASTSTISFHLIRWLGMAS